MSLPPCPRVDEVSAALAAHRASLTKLLEEWSEKQTAIFADALTIAPEAMAFRSATSSRANIRPQPTIACASRQPTPVSSLTAGGKPGPTPLTADGTADAPLILSSEPEKVLAVIPDPPETYLQELEQEVGEFGLFVEQEVANGLQTIIDQESKKFKSANDAAHIVETVEKAWGCVRGTRIVQAAEHLERSQRYHAFTMFVILLNSVFLAAQAEHGIRTLDATAGTLWLSVGEMFFTVYYTVEIALRLLALGPHFFCGFGCTWNWFDLLLVATALQDHLMTLWSSGETPSGNLAYLRIVRLMKLLKLMRFVKLWRSLHELRLVFDSMMGSVKAMFWSCCLIASIGFAFGLCFIEGATQFLLSEESEDMPKSREEMLKYWGSLGTSMVSLFQASTGGVDWAEIAAPLLHAGAHFYCLFCFYIAFFLLVVMNSITSIFVDGVREYSERDHNQLIQDQLDGKTKYVDSLMVLFAEIDSDNSGKLTYTKFVRALSHPIMIAFADSLEIESTDLQQFYRVLSANGEREVDVEIFVVGCIKLRGAAKSMDMVDVMLLLRDFVDRHAKYEQHIDDQFSSLHQILSQRVALPLPLEHPNVSLIPEFS